MRFIIGCFATALFFLAIAHAQEAQQKNVYGVDISPNGKHYAVLQQFGDQKAVAIYNIDNPDAQPVAVGLGQVDPGAFSWGGNNFVLVQGFGKRRIDTTDGLKEVEFARWLSIDKKTGEYKYLFSNEYGDDYFYYMLDSGALVSTIPSKADTALFARLDIEQRNQGASRIQEGDDEQKLALFTANLRTSRIKQQENGSAKTIRWVVDQNGEAIARIDQGSNDRKRRIFTRMPGNRSFKFVAEINFDDSDIEETSFLGAAAAEGNIQSLITSKSGVTTLVNFDMASGEFGEPIIDPSIGSIDAYEPDYRRGNASAVFISGNGLQIVHLDPADQTEQARLEKALGGVPIVIKSKADNGLRMIIKAYPADRTPEYYFYDRETSRLDMIAHE